jgi:UDP-2,3-diacylglucosamine hydrolase
MEFLPSSKVCSTSAVFLSDLHLQQERPLTTRRFIDFLRNQGSQTQQLYLLGDIFDFWAGDDELKTPYNHAIALAIRQISDSGIKTFWIPGNRDFLVGSIFAYMTGLVILPDPSVITVSGKSIAISHGDIQCTNDLEYMEFRSKVQQPQWKKQFLGLQLSQRKAIVASVRKEIQKNHRKTEDITDVNIDEVMNLFERTGTNILIHGHTHRPARHVLNQGKFSYTRYVLPDWDHDDIESHKRGGWISIDRHGVFRRFCHDGRKLPD